MPAIISFAQSYRNSQAKKLISTAILSIILCLIYNCFHLRPSAAEIVYSELSGRYGIEGRLFQKSPLLIGQQSNNISMFLEPEFYLESSSGNSFIISPFFRYDASDVRRTHWDFREAYALLFGEIGDKEWELRIGFDKVFWGVSESFHLVNIINQIDAIEDPNLESHLGQPMIHTTWVTNMGNLETYILPYFRERTFSGRTSRLRNAFIVDSDQTKYESAAGRRHLDTAVRYSNTLDIFDFGIAIFDGTNRAPSLSPGLDANGSVVLIPTYEQIRQYSLDAQVTSGPYLIKIEGYWRDGEKNSELIEDDYAAFIGGFEYSIYNLWNTDAEVTLLSELLFDERGSRSLTPFENDIFTAIRIALNDSNSTEFSFGIMQDLNQSSRSFSMDVARRIDNYWSIDFSTQVFLDIDNQDLQFPLRRDNYIELVINYSF